MVDSERVDHSFDQRRRLGIWVSAIVIGDECVGIGPNDQRRGVCLGSKAEVVGVFDWAVLGDAEAVPGLWRLLWLRLTGGRDVGGRIHGSRLGSWRDVCKRVPGHWSR